MASSPSFGARGSRADFRAGPRHSQLSLATASIAAGLYFWVAGWPDRRSGGSRNAARSDSIRSSAPYGKGDPDGGSPDAPRDRRLALSKSYSDNRSVTEAIIRRGLTPNRPPSDRDDDDGQRNKDCRRRRQARPLPKVFSPTASSNR